MASRRLALLVLAGLLGLAQGVNPLLGGVVPNATTCTGCELCQFLLKKGKEPGFEQAACPKKGPDQVPGEVAENGDAVDNACVARLHTLGKQCFALNATGCCNRQDPRETLNNFTVQYVVDDFAWPVLQDEAAMRNFTSAFATDVQQALRTNATVVVNDVRFPVPQTMASPAVLGSVEFSLHKADQRDFIAALSFGNSEVNAIPFSHVRSTFGRLPLASAILKKDGLPSSIEVLKKMAKRVITETVQTDLLRLNVNPEWVNDNMMKFQEALRTDIAAQTGAEESDVTIHNVNATNNATVVDVSLRGNQTIGDKQIKLTSLEAEVGEVVPVEYVGASEAEVVSDVQTRSKNRDKTPILLPPSPKHQHDPVRMEIKVRLAPAWIADSFNRNVSTNVTYEQFAKQLSFDLSIALRSRRSVTVISVKPSHDGLVLALLRVKNWDLATELDQQMSDLKSLVYRGVYSAYVDSTFDVDMPESPLSLKEQRAKARAKAEKARMDFIEKTGGNSSLSVSVSGSKTFVVRGAESRRCTNKNGGCDADALCIEAWSAGSHWPNNWCECNAGFEGDGFTCAPINPCVEAEGMVGTQCGPDSTCLSYAPGRAKCVCNSGYSGDGLYCAEIDNCKFGNGGCARPGGICTKTGPGSSVCHCDNGVDSFPFDNKAKYVGNGTYCEPYNPCKVNNGNCEKTAVCVFEGKPRKSHCECAPGYASNKKSLAEWAKIANAPENTTSLKLFCAPVNLCETNAHNCSVHAACRPRAPGKATCLCNAGYHGDGKTCRPANLCKLNNGGCDTSSSQCVKSGAGRNICECKRGFSKAPSGQCFAHSVCSSEKNPCHRNAKCADTAPGEYTCTCAKGFTGDGKYNCDPVMPCNFATKMITKCSDFSVCMMNPKPERDAGNLARCECLPGYQSAGTGSCVPVRRCDQINATGCHDNATCVNWGPGRRACICNDGYHGTGFECEAVNLCDINNGGCSARAKCFTLGPGERKCKCPSGYSTTDGGETCMPQNGCKRSHGGCHKHAMCYSPTPNTTACTCNLGYTGNGVTCDVLNNCNTGNDHCDDNAECSFTGPGTNNCTCNSGFKGSGALCFAINNCNLPNRSNIGVGECHEKATCEMSGPGMHRCVCKPGWTGSGTECEPVDNCEVGSHGCALNACCKMIGPGISNCTCNRGFIGDGRICKELNPCHYGNGGCHAAAMCTQTGPGRHTCTCPQFYTGDGKHCELDLTVCEPHKKLCDPNARCSPAEPGQKACFCNAGFRGDGKQCKEISPCASNTCPDNTKCMVSSSGKQVCKCKEGFTGDGSSACLLVNACKNLTCADNATCVRYAPGLARCVCKRGFYGNGTTCNATETCAINNGGCSLNANCTAMRFNERKCICKDGFVGDGIQCRDVSTLCCQCMSDTYGISHGRTYGHAPTSVIALFKKKGCETSPSVKARLLVPAGGDFKNTPLPGGLLQSARAPTPGTHINGQPIAEAMGYTSAKSLANKNDSDIEAGLTSLR